MAQRTHNHLFEQNRQFYGGIEVPACPPPQQEIIIPALECLPNYKNYTLPRIEETLKRAVEQTAGVDLPVVRPPARVEADYALPLGRLFQERGAEKTKADLSSFMGWAAGYDQIESAELEGAYLNLKLDSVEVGTDIVKDIEAAGDTYGVFNMGNGDRVVIDTSSPNIAKEMTVAHLRSTVIGESLGRLYQAAGYEVIRDNHLGDWGTQFGILGRAYELWGHEVADLKEGGDPIKGLFELYVRINSAISAGAEIEKEKEKYNKTLNEEEQTIVDTGANLRQEGQEWFRRLEEGDSNARQLWQWAKDISLVEANQLYQRLGSNFEYILGESEYVGMVPSLLDSLKDLGLARKEGRVSKDGKQRTVVKFGRHNKLGDLPFLKSDDTSLYATRDLACLAARNVWFDPAKIIYVVGGEQTHYFKQVFHGFNLYSRLVGEQSTDMEHVSFGMVKLPEGKMSTRRGNVIFLEDVVDEGVARAKSLIEERSAEQSDGLSEAEIADIAEKVGVGAVIYSELRQPRSRKIKFDWDEMLSFQGNSGPFLQYTNARINSIFRKLPPDYEIDYKAKLAITNEQEAKLAQALGGLPLAIKTAVEKNEPSVVADYLYHLSNTYNGFYKVSPVLKAGSKQSLDTRLRLSAATAQVLRTGMNLLGVPIPERM